MQNMMRVHVNCKSCWYLTRAGVTEGAVEGAANPEGAL